MKKLIVAWLWLIPFSVFAQQSVTFRIKNTGLTVEGKFSSFNFEIDYNKLDPGKSSFSGWVEIESINTGIKARDNHLKKSEYFDAEKYPKMTFQSTEIAVLSAEKLKVKGNLTIKNTTKSINIEVLVSQEASGKTKFTSTFKINRLDYKVGGSSWVLSDELEVSLSHVQ